MTNIITKFVILNVSCLVCYWKRKQRISVLFICHIRSTSEHETKSFDTISHITGSFCGSINTIYRGTFKICIFVLLADSFYYHCASSTIGNESAQVLRNDIASNTERRAGLMGLQDKKGRNGGRQGIQSGRTCSLCY